MAKALSPLQRELVEEFGNIYESYGLQRLKGLIVGLLLTQSDPASLDDMTELLERSKGPISSAVRALAEIGIIRKTNGPVNRRDYYEADPDIFYNNFKFNMTTVRKNRELAARLLEQARLAGTEAAMVDNLEQMLAFYSLMESFYQDFSAQWEEMKRERRRQAAA